MGEMETDDSWSLIAVVKECARKAKLRYVEESSLTTTATTTVPEVDHLGTNHSCSQNSFFNQVVLENKLVGYTLPLAAGAAIAAPTANHKEIEDELRDLYKPFLLPHPPPVISTIKAESAAEACGNLTVEQNSQQQLHLRDFRINPKQSSSSAVSVNHDHCFQKKKKFEDRRVVRVTLEDLSRYDKWAWRKYGQKPIKGSPYPRNYYRCSSTKGCKARKQVERSPVDPMIYIVTYTGHHQHPCPLIRNSGGHRVKASGSKSDPPPEKKNPSGTVPVPVQIEYGYGYGYGYVSGGNNGVKIEDEECGDENGDRARDHESLSSGVMDDGYNDHEKVNPNSMPGSDVLPGMEQLSGGEKNNSFINNNQYNGNVVGFDEIIVDNRGCDPIVKMEIQLNGNGSGYGIGIREMYASAPATLAGAHETPSNMVQNIWDNGMIRPQVFLF